MGVTRLKTKPVVIVTLGDVAGVVKKAFIDKRVNLIGCETPITLPGWGQTTAIIQPVTLFDVKRFGSAKLGLVQVTGMFDDGGRCMAFVSANTVVELAPEETPPPTATTGVFAEPEAHKLHLALVKHFSPFREKYVQYVMGADPEIFVVKSDKSLLAAFEFLPDHETALGLKKPSPSTMADRGFAYHPFWDGYQAEFNVKEDFCIAYMVDSIRGGLNNVLSEARKKDPSAKLSLKTTMDVPLERLATDDRRYVQFGCTPSLNVYSDEEFPEVEPASIPFRSAGGHIHISYTDDVKPVVIGLDRILGVISVSLFQKYDDPRRRILYGRAGEYRKTPYGLEYRVLSNAWLANPIITNMVYELARRITWLGNWKEWVATEKEVRDCINNCDVAAAHAILNRNINQLHGLVRTLPSCNDKSDRLVKMIFEGVHTVLRNPDELSESWQLGLPHQGYGKWMRHGESSINSLGRGIYVLEKTGYFD